MNNASGVQDGCDALCTLETSEALLRQPWYNCYTCGLLKGKGVCKSCAARCHRNHKLSLAKMSEFFCDCGAAKINCKALLSDESKLTLGNEMCTYSVQRKPFRQRWYHCRTCGLGGSRGVCSECARTCHKSHDLAYAHFSTFSCSCGSTMSGSCKTTVKDELDLAKKLCTFTVTGKEHTKQHWFRCYTCNMIDKSGVCLICAKTCHKNHALVYASNSTFFCDCGAYVNACKALKPNFESMPYYRAALQMGLDEDLVRRAVHLNWEATGDPDMDVDYLTDAVRKLQAEDVAKRVVDVERNEEEGASADLQCKICLGAEVEVMFVPCGHLIACRGCAGKISECALCRKKIDQKPRAYFS